MTAAPVTPTLDDVLDEARRSLHDRARRLFALEPFVAAITRDSLAKRFTIHDDIVWTMLLDSRDKLRVAQRAPRPEFSRSLRRFNCRVAYENK